MTMYMLTTIPRDRAGAISERYSGATTVSPPAPRPAQMRAKSISPRIPEEKTCIRAPVIHRATKNCQARRRPRRSFRPSEMMEPKAAPRTPNDEMLALRSARPDALPCQRLGSRPKSCLNEDRPVEALKPPSSYPIAEVSNRCPPED